MKDKGASFNPYNFQFTSYRRDSVKHFCTVLGLAPSKHPKLFPSVTPTNLKGSCWLCFRRQSSTFAQTKLNCLVSISNTSSKNRGQVFLRRCERLTGFSGIVDDAVTVGYLHFFFFHHKEYGRIFNNIHWCLVKFRQACACCACQPCRQRGIAADNPILCNCVSWFF